MFFNKYSGGWKPIENQHGNNKSNDNHWIQAAFDYPFKITAIRTQGESGWTAKFDGSSKQVAEDGLYVKSYKISYSNDGVSWEVYKNEDGTEKVI